MTKEEWNEAVRTYIREHGEKHNDDYWIENSVLFEFFKTLPPVTPARPKGKWVLVQRGKYVDVGCNKCKSIRIMAYAYNYTIEQLLADKENIANLLAQDDMRYCPCCGAEMEVSNDESN